MSLSHAKHDPIRHLLMQGKREQAVVRAQRAFQSSPRDPAAAYVLSEALLASGQVDRAVHFAKTAAGLAPAELSCLMHYATTLGVANKQDEALAVLSRAAAIAPRDPAVYSARAGVELELNRCTLAERTCRAGLEVAPADINLCTQLAATLLNLGRVEEALVSMRAAAAMRPDSPEFASGLSYLMNYAPDESPNAVLAQHRRYGELLEAQAPTPPRVFANSKDPQRRLRIGLVSPDLRAHSVAWFIEPFMEHHDRARVELVVYQTNFIADGVTARLRKHCETWRVMDRVNDEQLSEVIFADKIDILIELSGHTHLHSLRALHARPAPVQMTYLGYPNITGLRQIDYRIVDSITDPPALSEGAGPERFLYLDPCFLCYKPPAAAEPSLPPSASAGFVTFGSFNTVHKLNRRLIALWVRLLHAVPNSRLVLKGVAFTDAELREDVRRRFIAAGLDSSRIEVLSKAESLADHLGLYSRIDIGLDPLPYNGTTTTCEALYMGVPVVTLAGRLHAGRVGASLLTSVGLTELIARNEDDYIAKAAALATDAPRLAAIRASLRSRVLTSPLCDGPGFAGRMEAVLRRAWQTWCGVNPP